MDKESITFESVLMQLTENYQTSCMIVETTACQSWRVFLRHGVYYEFFFRRYRVSYPCYVGLSATDLDSLNGIYHCSRIVVSDEVEL